MKKTTIYGIRLAVGIALTALAALACQSVLDFDSLKAKTPGSEAGVREAGKDVVIPDKPPILPDTGKCVSGSPCSVANKHGECAKGAAQCYETGVDGVCKQTVQPAKELCDGKDGDCDGIPDASDPDTCAGETSCKGSPLACTLGCATSAACTNGNTCDPTAHTCKCGGTGPRCTGSQVCDPTPKACRCGTKKLVCGANENCEAGTAGAGACVCGATKSETGKACAEPQVCLGASPNKACGIKPDAGPDKGPPADKGPDKPPSIDKSIVDQPPVQVDKGQVIDKAQVIDKTPLDQTKVDLT